MKAGRYKARALEASLGKSKTENPRVVVRFEVQDGECQGETVLWYGALVGGAKDITLTSLRLCGWDGKNIADFVAGNPKGFGNQDVQIVVELKSSPGAKGEPRPQVAWVNPVDGVALQDSKKLTREEAEALAISFGQSTVEDVERVDIPF